MNKVHLFVEGEADKIIIQNILSAARYPLEQVDIEVAGGKHNVINFSKNAAKNKATDTIVSALLDADTLYIQDAISESEKKFIGYEVEIFIVIPEIETWLFADDGLVKKYVSEKQRNAIARLPLPQEISFPKKVYENYLRKKNASGLKDEYAFLLEMDITRAAARCPALNYFLKKLGHLLRLEEDEVEIVIEEPSRQFLPKQIFANLLQEVMPSEIIVFRTLSGRNISAKDMQEAVLQDTAEGKEYISDILRFARDILKMQVKKEQSKLKQ